MIELWAYSISGGGRSAGSGGDEDKARSYFPMLLLVLEREGFVDWLGSSSSDLEGSVIDELGTIQ